MPLEPRRLHELREEAARAGRDTVFDPTTIALVRGELFTPPQRSGRADPRVLPPTVLDGAEHQGLCSKRT